jgi:hypothetical protein
VRVLAAAVLVGIPALAVRAPTPPVTDWMLCHFLAAAAEAHLVIQARSVVAVVVVSASLVLAQRALAGFIQAVAALAVLAARTVKTQL